MLSKNARNTQEVKEVNQKARPAASDVHPALHVQLNGDRPISAIFERALTHFLLKPRPGFPHEHRNSNIVLVVVAVVIVSDRNLILVLYLRLYYLNLNSPWQANLCNLCLELCAIKQP